MSHYHTQHSPFGAFASFTCGLPGTTGGFGQSLKGPADQNLCVAHRTSDGVWQQLPFLDGEAADGALAYLGDTPAAFTPTRVRTLAPDTDYTRHLGWASDTWQAGPFRFSLYSPWDKTADPATLAPDVARFAFAPVVCGELSYDNTGGAGPVELFFGVNNPGRPWRPLTDVAPALLGFAAGPEFGFATASDPAVALHQGFDAYQMRLHDHRGIHLLGHHAGLRFTVAAGERRGFPITLGFFRSGIVTTGITARYHYTTLFRDLEDVLRHGLARHADYLGLAARRDAELDASKLDADQRWLLAQATHSYLGSTQLLSVGEGRQARPLWVVNEGEYRMINTLDLTVDHLFFELEWQPWAVRNALDFFASRYSYTDTLRTPDGRRAEGGLSFCHDQGVADQFTPAGYSSYEARDLQGCFSHMAMEQLLNWICCAVTYAEHTADKTWLKKNREILDACAESLRRRDDPDEKIRDGLLKWDSSRCGERGSEITTYDSLDVSLGQARNNLYIQSKALAAWLLLERAYTTLGRASSARAAGKSADLAARAILQKHEAATGFFPAIFEAGNQSRILPAVEGLVFPLFLGWADEVRARYPELFAAYEHHLARALQPGVCLDAKSGAWKISSTSTNTWYSKIALAQHVVRRLFPAAVGPVARTADAVHARFQQSVPLGRFAMVDQVRSTDGGDLGSRYYPRIVTACLWLQE
ncbi:hypothetical protein IMCC26134_03515 [Verrucomicrobia bacterium IMCC26134]|nr:hypothetical protein IMCC26134_03515 [Verrucomicrobia bacterium IMCC26134]